MNAKLQLAKSMLVSKDIFYSLFDGKYYIKQLKKYGLIDSIGYEDHYLDAFSNQIITQARLVQIPDAEILLLIHYLSVGCIKEISPHWLYDPKFIRHSYKLANPACNIFAFCFETEYLTFDPHPLFMSKFYSKTWIKAESEVHPLVHYLMTGRFQAKSPHILFDPVWYSQEYGVEISESLKLFIEEGKSSKDPSPLFSSSHVFKQISTQDLKCSALEYYLTVGDEDGLSPHGLFDPLYFRSQFGSALSKLAYIDYLQQFHEFEKSPHPSFFSQWYRKAIGATESNYSHTMLHHYLYYGYNERRPISPYTKVREVSPSLVRNTGSTNNSFVFKNVVFEQSISYDVVEAELEKFVDHDIDLLRLQHALKDGIKIQSINFDDVIQRSIVNSLKKVASYDNLVISLDDLRREDLGQILSLFDGHRPEQIYATKPVAVLGCQIDKDILPDSYSDSCLGVPFDLVNSDDGHLRSEIIKGVIFSLYARNVIFVLSKKSLIFLEKYLTQLCHHFNVIFCVPDRLDNIDVAAFVAERSFQKRVSMQIVCASTGDMFKYLTSSLAKSSNIVSCDVEHYWKIEDFGQKGRLLYDKKRY